MTPESFLLFANALPESVLLVSGDGAVLAVNRACEEQFGISGRAWRPRPLADLVVDPPHDVGHYLTLCSRSRQTVLGGLTVRGRDERRCRAEGRLIHPKTEDCEALLLLRLMPKQAASSQFAALNLRIEDLGREVQRRRLAEEDARAHADRLRTTLASIGDAVITTDIHGHVTNMNAVAETLTGWTNGEAAGRLLTDVFDIVNETTREPVESPADRALRDGAVVGLANRTVLVSKNGSELPIDDSAAPIRTADGDVIGCVLVFRDVTERRRSALRVADALRFYRSSIDALASHIAVLDEHGVILEVNHAWRHFAEMNQFAGSDCGVGSNYLAACGTSADACGDEGQIAQGIRDVLYGRAPVFEFEYPCHSPTEKRWFLMRVTPFNSPGPVRVVVCHDNVTNRRIAEEQLRASNARLLGILRQSPAGIVCTDAAGRMTLVNERWCQMLGYDEAGLLRKTVLEVTHPVSIAATTEALARLAAGGPDFQIEKTYCRQDGSLLHAQSNVTALRSDDNEFVGLIAVILDISDRLRTEDELRRLAAELSDADRLKNLFLATLAHELRNPLAPIRNGLELMRLAGGNLATIERARTMIDRQVQQMVRLVDDLLDMGRISTGKIRLQKEPVPLVAVLESAVETSRPLIDQMGHALTIVWPPGDLLVDADATRLAQVFSNLLNNAAKYSEPNGTIELRAEQHGSDVVISVKDTGIGMSADQLPGIFNMFWQVHHSLERSQGGLGIGLSLVKGLVDLHGGSVEALSGGPDQGSTFVVRLPVATDAQLSRHDATSGHAVDTRSLHILIVDDSRDSAESLAMMLELMGNKAFTAYDGEEAVAEAKRLQPDVILLDLGLPKLNGFAACRRIRQEEAGRPAVIIAHTGWGQEEDRQRTREAGFDHHLAKPLDPDALIRLLQPVSPLPRRASDKNAQS